MIYSKPPRNNALKFLALASCAMAMGLTSCAPNSNDAGAQTSTEVTAAPTIYEQTIKTLKSGLEARMEAGVPVPVPVDGGGGYTHEQHKQNYKTIYEAGMLYAQTKDPIYKDFAAQVMADYADLYPTLGLHPKVKPATPSKLFWQGLNEAVWLVYVIQGYEAVKADLTQAQRTDIETNLLRPMADFLSAGSPQTFNRIHNHGTWAAAAVGMTGYVLEDQHYIDIALRGLDKTGEVGFLKQLSELFSPDGYYTEGPYYQRYAMMPYLLFAKYIDANDPDIDIFGYRDGVLLKAVYATIQLSYNTKFFPINDAIRAKGLNTVELHHGIGLAYAKTGDPSLLDIAQFQGVVIPNAEGKNVADALAAGKAEPFVFKSKLYSDGPNGQRGALGVLRSGSGKKDAAVVMKATAQGLGHGHFDRLGFLYFDNGNEIVADYGASRFLNVEPKFGGRYLPENKTWAKQSIAHNVLVVDQTTQFGGDWRKGEESSAVILAYDDTAGKSFMAAETDAAYEGVGIRRILAMTNRSDGGNYVIDVVIAQSDATHSYDLPVHYRGQLIETGFPFTHNVDSLKPLGDSDGYQHLWLTAQTPDFAANTVRDFSFLLEDQFYTLTTSTNAPARAALVQTGANDPDNNLRHEKALLLRTQAKDAVLVSVYERHGRYDSDEEVTVYNGGSIADIKISDIENGHQITLETESGESITILSVADTATDAAHSVDSLNWTGPIGLIQTDNEK